MGEITASSMTGLKGDHCVSVGDIAVDDPLNPSTVRTHLSHSKTDQFGK